MSGRPVLEAGPGRNPSTQRLATAEDRETGLTGGVFARLLGFLHHEFKVVALALLPVTHKRTGRCSVSKRGCGDPLVFQLESGDPLNFVSVLFRL